MKRLVFGILAAAACSGATTSAHHSFAAIYLVDKQITIEGDLLQFMFRNPHSFLHVQAPDAKGQMQRWAIEWTAAGQLTGISSDTLKPGDHVIITGNPGRTTEDHRIRMHSIRRPKDGFTWIANFQSTLQN